MATRLHHETPHLLPNLGASLARFGRSIATFMSVFHTSCQLAAEAEAENRLPDNALERLSRAAKPTTR